MSNPDPMAEIRASFFVECEELLEALQDGLQTLESGSHDDETIHIVFRAVHSIKGGAGAFGLDDLVQFSHHYETVLDQVRDGRLAVTPNLLGLFFRAADQLSDIVRACRDDADAPTDTGDAILAELDAHLDEKVEEDVDEDISFTPTPLSLDLDADIEEPSSAGTTYTISFTPEPELYETGNDVPHIFGALAELGALDVTCDTSRLPELKQLAPEANYFSWSLHLTTDVDHAEVASVFEFVEGLCDLEISCDRDALPRAAAQPTLRETSEEATTNGSTGTNDQTTKSSAQKTVVRVDIDRIERLVNLVGELVINQAMLAQSLQSAGLSPHSDAMNGLDEFQRLTRDIQDSVMMIRAQPVKSLFQRMSRIVRETSASVCKDVRLVTDGETTEVDKTVIERLADPLTHMIRNAVDHGLEETQTRLANGKPAQGQVRLSAAHRSGRVVIEVSDDGGGIDRDTVLQIAVDKGLVPSDSGLSDAEIDNLLFLPGFSTASNVSDLSGRGVGMDVVRTAIQSLGGRITTSSEPGRGTTFSISLPLTLAVLDGMVVEVSGETLVLPLNVVSETLTLSDTTVECLQPGYSVVRVRDGFVPLFDLGAALGYRPPCDTYVDRVALLLALEDDTRVALVVDEIQDQRQVVIKGLDDSYYRAPGIAAATILGDGQIALILDPSDIVAHAPKQRARAITPQSLEA
ncbi:chemotaxis protein CheA [uncultured Tateyamaria sp.]|uniref:chemotaxis protein CheA n=1 Tax=uncultured Tateyamaria sp. TaxID=455651 RepID=UPI00261B9279|nr:chemotaxis protein CheA [uncultured Tateyamaria sp.]